MSNGSFYPITVAHSLGITVDQVVDEFEILAEAEMIDLRDGPDGQRISMTAKLSRRGRAVLAEGRKASRRLAESYKDASSSNTQDIVVRAARDANYAYDAFISYAGEDRAYARELRDRLVLEGVSIWIDEERVDVGDTIVRDVDLGIASSRYAILLLSKFYFEKAYTRAEFDALIKRQIEVGNVILPILMGDVTQVDVSKFSSYLSTVKNINAQNSDLDDLITQLLKVLRPPVVVASTPPQTPIANTRPPGPETGRPYDALDDDPALAPIKPRLNVVVTGYVQQDPQHVDIMYEVRNIGAGTASKVRIFLPGLVVESPGRPISPIEPYASTLIYSERRAFADYMPPPVQAIAEFEDSSGNLYRQYGAIGQQQSEYGYYRYVVEELNRPYLVPQRIIDPDPTRLRFRR
jgi:hypothetical protein